jgi:hypothetical protein
MSGLAGDDVELEELDRVGGPVVTRANVRPELVRPDHVMLLASKSEAPGVVDKLSENLDVLACFTDVIDGTVMIFSATLEGDVCVFQSYVGRFHSLALCMAVASYLLKKGRTPMLSSIT